MATECCCGCGFGLRVGTESFHAPQQGRLLLCWVFGVGTCATTCQRMWPTPKHLRRVGPRRGRGPEGFGPKIFALFFFEKDTRRPSSAKKVLLKEVGPWGETRIERWPTGEIFWCCCVCVVVLCVCCVLCVVCCVLLPKP